MLHRYGGMQRKKSSSVEAKSETSVWGCRETGNLFTAINLRLLDLHMHAHRLVDIELELFEGHLVKRARVNDSSHQWIEKKMTLLACAC
jgi:hypothetical protein